MSENTQHSAGTAGPDCSDLHGLRETVRLRSMTNAEVAEELRQILRAFSELLTTRSAFTLLHAAKRLDGTKAAMMCKHTRFLNRCPICNPNASAVGTGGPSKP